MKKEIAEKWVEALRSGKYKQTKGKLRTPKGYCCLGVLCDISGISKWELGNEITGEYRYDRSRNFLPMSVKERTGINIQQDLVLMNDNGKSFDVIADYIEKHQEEL